jgi:hypothetical protein
MFLTKKEDILKAMNKDIEGASASTANWLAETFDVPPSSKPSPQNPVDYEEQYAPMVTNTIGK